MNAFNRPADEEARALNRCRLPVSNHFPPNVRDALVAASQHQQDGDPMARTKEINRVIERARLQHPELFATQE